MSGTEIELDENGEVVFVNETGFDDDEILAAIKEQAPEIYAEVSDLAWARNPFSPTQRSRARTIFEQNRYVAPNNIFDEFRLAAYAAKYDDIVSNAVDTTENLAFKRIAVETDSDMENDIWRQIVDDIDMPQRMREMWRDQFIYSQFYFCAIWHRKSYKVKRKSDAGNKSRKEYRNLLVPRAISLLDPLRVIPVGSFLFNQEKLVYIAEVEEAKEISEKMDELNKARDPVVDQMFIGRYEPGPMKLQEIRKLTGQLDLRAEQLFYLNPENCWRVTATRPAYDKFATVRLASIFELLDLKHILRAMDREEMLSATNVIILVKKGSDEYPAEPGELAAAAAQVTQAARIPIIVSDHRMEVEIITRKTDKVLQPERYNGLDSRLTARLYQILSTGNYASGTATDNSPNLFKIIASTMESRRDNIRDALMTRVINTTWERNNKQLVEYPSMNFYPRRIALDFDNNISTFMQDLKDRNVISAETLLAEMDILLDEEIAKIKREQEKYPDILMQYQVPYSATTTTGKPQQEKVEQPAETAPAAAVTPGKGKTTGVPKADGRAGGGNSNGGGRNKDSTKPSPNNRGK